MSDYIVGSRKPKVGEKVLVVQKKDYGSGELTSGTVKDVLTSKEVHPRGHKVRLTSGIIGRVQQFSDQISSETEVEPTAQTPKPYTPSPDDLV